MRPRQPRVRVTRSNAITRAGMVPLPANFRPQQAAPYPPDNTIPFERWYMDNYVDADQRERVYLPMQWTALYCNNNYGKCHKTKLHIQGFLDGLDREKKYYTIVQYDDGILNNLSHLDIKVCAMSGPRIDYPLPLIAMPHQYTFNVKKDILASFVGRVTHPIRAEMFKQLKDKKDFHLLMDALPLKHYCELMARSKYALCPRGYGQTSFRIQEAIQYNAIPVYISDQFVWPYQTEHFEYGIMLKQDEDIAEYLEFHNQHRYDITLNLLAQSKHLFTYQGCKQEILGELKREQDVP